MAAIAIANSTPAPDCPSNEFHSADYLEAAVGLQTLGRDEAIRQLEEWAEFRECEEQVVILCKMLFVVRSGQEFDKPVIGRFLHHPGGTTAEDWPLEPITLFEDVPFLVASGRGVAAQPASDYLKRCVRELTWRPEKYRQRSPEQLKEVVHRFVVATDWRIPASEPWKLPWIELKFLTQALVRSKMIPTHEQWADEAWKLLQQNGSNPLPNGFR